MTIVKIRCGNKHKKLFILLCNMLSKIKAIIISRGEMVKT